MKFSRITIACAVALVFSSCARHGASVGATNADEIRSEGYSLTAASSYWATLSPEDLGGVSSMAEATNGKLPLNAKFATARSGASGALMTVGTLETDAGSIPSQTDIQDYVDSITANAQRENAAQSDSGRRGKTLYWVINVKTEDSFSVKSIFYRSQSAKPLFVDFYVPTNSYNENVQEEITKVLDSVDVK